MNDAPRRLALAELAQLPGPVLALDTSEAVSIAIVAPTGVLAVASDPAPRRHAELLAPMIAELLDTASLAPGDLVAVAVGRGPAPYTGLRVGLATAQAFAEALGIPAWGVGCLDALALGAVESPRAAEGDRILAVLDAKRREVFARAYRVDEGGASPLGVAVAVRPEDAREATGLAEASAVVGREIVAGAASLLGLPGPDDAPDPVVIARLGAWLADAAPATPVYLRRPDVTPPAGRKRATA